jgi:hypothetical protein
VRAHPIRDNATRQVVMGLMDELMDPNLLVGRDEVSYLQGDQHSGDLLAGKDGATKLEVLDAMIAEWMTDPVTTATKPGTSEKKIDLVGRGEDHYANSNKLREDSEPDNRNFQQIFIIRKK